MAMRSSQSSCDSSRSTSTSWTANDVEEQVRTVETDLNLELCALRGLATEVSRRLAELQTQAHDEPAGISDSSAMNRSLGVISNQRKRASFSRISGAPAEAQAAEGHRVAFPVGARARRAGGPDGGLEKCKEMLKDIQQLEAQCRMLLEHLDPVAKKISERSKQSSNPNGSLDRSFSKHLRQRLKEARTLCAQSRELSFKALRYTSAGSEWRWDVAPAKANTVGAHSGDDIYKEELVGGGLSGEQQLRVEA